MATAIEQWGSLLSVPMGRIRPHFWSFSAAAVLHLAFNIYANLTAAAAGACQRWQDLPSAIVADTISANLFWLVYSPILVEVVYMVIAAIFLNKKQKESREEGREEGLEEGVAKGVARADLAWREWNDRRMAAALNGVPFNDPPPNFANGNGRYGDAG